MCSDDRCARKDLRASGGNQVDGLPPVPVGRANLKRQCSDLCGLCRVCHLNPRSVAVMTRSFPTLVAGS
eukprot:7071105-Pyramimonas_sp.AAC.1